MVEVSFLTEVQHWPKPKCQTVPIWKFSFFNRYFFLKTSSGACVWEMTPDNLGPPLLNQWLTAQCWDIEVSGSVVVTVHTARHYGRNCHGLSKKNCCKRCFIHVKCRYKLCVRMDGTQLLTVKNHSPNISAGSVMNKKLMC